MRSTPGLLPPRTPAVPVVPAHWSLPAGPASVSRARRAVSQGLPDGCPPRLAADLTLLVSELVTNAVRHGTRPGEEEVIEVVLWPSDGHYWLAVSDPGSRMPALAAPGPGACGGRGLVLVDALSAVWAVVPRRTCGKTVVAGVPLLGG
ncbi:ATP-binding protein [Peterkaempfera griseoplana]|uniref:ATP-binding protein n=1 Tax=Peterkaempfera griseoplana TaxID=66896 RepID=UPI0006E3F2E3|nr:ATP-binding protein [Peterkaempfera griseoplana]